jgi:hypothetical protein
MSLKSILAALTILGSSSLAMADVYGAQNGSFHQVQTVPAPVIVKPAPIVRPIFNPIPKPPVAVDDCNNTTLGGDSSAYNGPIGTKTWGESWVALTQPTRIDRGREFFHIGEQAGRFDQLKLENTAGRSYITQVLVEYANGKSQVVHLNENLNASNPCITINLSGRDRAISRIVVYGSTARHSSYQILAA